MDEEIDEPAADTPADVWAFWGGADPPPGPGLLGAYGDAQHAVNVARNAESGELEGEEN